MAIEEIMSSWNRYYYLYHERRPDPRMGVIARRTNRANSRAKLVYGVPMHSRWRHMRRPYAGHYRTRRYVE